MRNPKNWAALNRSLKDLKEFLARANEAEAAQKTDEEFRMWQRLALLREARRLSKAVQIELDRTVLEAEQFWATHWRDDDSPQYERSFGTCKVAA